MTDATDYALQLRVAAGRTAQVATDIAAGFMATSRFVVTFVGCLTLVGAAVIVSNDTARARFIEHAPAVVGHWLVNDDPEPAQSADSAAVEIQPVAFDGSSEPQQRFVTQYLSRRYRVADEAVRLLVAAAFQSGRDHGLDPLLILAVMAVESSMNPFAESAVGAQGLMQVMTRVHSDKFESHGGDHAALDPIANIKVGSAILKDLIRRGGSVERGLQLYVGAGNLPDDAGYGARVLSERSRIALAASGKVDGALNSGIRADAARASARAASIDAAVRGSTQSTLRSDSRPADVAGAA